MNFCSASFPRGLISLLKLFVRENICLYDIASGHVPLSMCVFSLEIDCSDFSTFLSSSGLSSEAKWRGRLLPMFRSCILGWPQAPQAQNKWCMRQLVYSRFSSVM